MWTKEQLLYSLIKVEEVINTQTEAGNPILLTEKLNAISNIIGLSVKCVGEAEAIYCNKLSEMTYRITKEKPDIGSNERKIFVNGEIGEHIELYTRADKLNKALVDCSTNLRTLISYIKHEIPLST